jgi:3-oxoacyl-[acyl-carrier-protein] synthase-3
MTEQAVARLIADNPELASEIDVVVVASGTTMPMAHPTDPNNPSFADLSPLVLRQIGRNDAMGLDIKACYCTGFLRGLQTLDALLANPNYRAGLLVATEQGSRFATAASNRTSFCYIVGDAAGVVALRRIPGYERRGIIDYCGHTEVDKLDWVGIGEDAASIVMLGSKAADATREMLLSCGRRLLRRNGLIPSDIDWLLPIQSHFGLIDSVRQQLEFPSEKLLWFGDVNGFSGSASIPSCLAEQRAAGRVSSGQLVLSLAVGAGMNCAGALYTV